MTGLSGYVLETLAREARPLLAREIANRTGLTLRALSSVLGNLRQRGRVTQQRKRWMTT